MINQMEGKNDTQYINPQVVLLLLVIEEQHVAESGAMEKVPMIDG